jgi:hypothetical protein
LFGDLAIGVCTSLRCDRWDRNQNTRPVSETDAVKLYDDIGADGYQEFGSMFAFMLPDDVTPEQIELIKENLNNPDKNILNGNAFLGRLLNVNGQHRLHLILNRGMWKTKLHDPPLCMAKIYRYAV